MRQLAQTLAPTAADPGCRYLLYSPAGAGTHNPASTARRWPLVLFLHGSGERGDNLDLVAVHGPPKLIEAGHDYPCFVASPQCPDGGIWSPALLLRLLDDLESRLPVDRARVCVTGISMGGYGTWEIARTAPQRFAAIAPICGGAPPLWSWVLKGLPIWAFHGDKDSVVPVEQSKDIIDWMIREKAEPPPRLTIYKGVGHDSWTETYNNPKLFEWLLSHKH
ncbi:MAG: dienelactone hydrolase family protein [Planctomycetota bacterium]|nr:dienelactone hydrolase family protein [Planctomycetota bacterium]